MTTASMSTASMAVTPAIPSASGLIVDPPQGSRNSSDSASTSANGASTLLASPSHADASATPAAIPSTSTPILGEPSTADSATTSSNATPTASSHKIASDTAFKDEDEDEDARLLASLASGSASTSQPGPSKAGGYLPTSFPAAIPTEQQLQNGVEAEDMSGPIQAYAKLEFPGFSYYIQTLDCTIGRRPAHMRTPALKEGEVQHITGAKKMEGDVDIDLGLLKSISRLHVRIFYQDQPRQVYPGMLDMHGRRGSLQGRFVLQVLGRNGAFVDDVPVGRDVVVPLGKRTKIQIAERVFYFVLPPAPPAAGYNSDGELGSSQSASGSGDEDGEGGSLGSSSESEDEAGASLSSEDEEAAEEVRRAAQKKRPKLVLKKKLQSSSVSQGKGKGKGKGTGKGLTYGKANGDGSRKLPTKRRESGDEDFESSDGKERDSKKVAKGPSKTKLPGASDQIARKRKRGDASDQEPQVTLKVGTPIGVEALNLKNSKKKRKAESTTSLGTATEGSGDVVSSTSPNFPGRGKGGGKAHIAAAAIAAKAKLEEEKKRTSTVPKLTQPVPVPSPNSAAPATASSNTAPIRPAAATSSALASMNAPPIVSPQQQQINGVARSVTGPIPATSVRPNPPISSAPGPGQALSRPSPTTLQTQRPLAGSLQGSSQVPFSQSSPRPPLPVSNPGMLASAPSTFPPSAAPFAHLTNTNQAPASMKATPQPLPAEGPGIKPELSNMDIVRNALANPLSMSRGGKLTLQEIYEDISGKYEWYRNNNRTNGRDWHSSIRHAVGNSREMIRIPRKANDQGKGVFYAFSNSEAARQLRLESDASSTASLPVQSMSPGTPGPAPAASSAAASPNVASPAPQTPLARPTPVAASPAARPSPPIQPNGRVTIMIGKAPAEALAQMAKVPKAAITQSIEALFGGPPIVHHEGKLYLSPIVFGHMSPSEISDIGGKGAQQALAILQGHLVSHLQSKMKKSPGPAGQSVRPTGSPLQPTAPTGAASPRPPTGQTARPTPSPRPATPAVGQTSGAGVRPAPRPAASISRPSAPQPPRPVLGAQAGQVRPIGSPAVSTVQPMGTTQTNIARRPPMNRPGTPTGQGVRPTASPELTRPAALQPQGQSAASLQARPQGTSQGALPARPPTSGLMQRPSGATGRPSTPITAQVYNRPVAPVARPNASAPQQTSVRSPNAPASSIAVRPNPVNTSTVAAQSVPQQSTLAPAAAAAVSTVASVASASTSAPVASTPPSSNAMMSAMQALASHSDAAGLMTLLSGGNLDSGTKLTPGQLDLLQRAGRIAAEQQRAQQQRLDQPKLASTAEPVTPTPLSSAPVSSTTDAALTNTAATQPTATPAPSSSEQG